MRPLWTGAVSFGLINIPVKLYSATQSSDLDLDMLHVKDHAPIRYARFCTKEDKEVPYREIVKGHEYRKGEYVVLEKADFERADAGKTNAINLVAFVDQAGVDAMLYEKPYYLEPAKNAEKPYALLCAALKKAKKAGVATFVLRNREHLALVSPVKNVLVLHQLRFQEEIRPTKELRGTKGDVSAAETEMAIALIDRLSGSFDPAVFKDTYTHALEKVIDAKAHGRTPKAKKAAPKRAKTNDLASLLRESIEREQGRPSKKKAGTKAVRRPHAKKRPRVRV